MAKPTSLSVTLISVMCASKSRAAAWGSTPVPGTGFPSIVIIKSIRSTTPSTRP